MVKVNDIYKFIDSFAPFATSMDFDNCGLLVGNNNANVDNVLVSLDITNRVVEEAINLGANLIISHHPVIFKPMKNVMHDSVVYNLIKNDISAICAHTNLDMAEDTGVNTCLANALELKNLRPLSIYKSENYNKIVVFVPEPNANDVIKSMSSAGAGILGNYSECSFSSSGTGTFRPNNNSNPFIGKVGHFEKVNECRVEMICDKSKTQSVIKAMLNSHPYEMPAYDIFETSAIKHNISCGLIGDLKNEYSANSFAKYVKDKLHCNGIRYFNFNDNIKTVALCSGAGGNMISRAINENVSAFITGEIKHHEIIMAEQNNVSVFEAGHFKTEDVVIQPLINKLKEKFKQTNFVKSKYFTDQSLYV